MSNTIYIALIIIAVVLMVSIMLFIQFRKNGHTELYKEGVRNENDGNYLMALKSFEEALNENKKLKLGGAFGIKISQRIKVLRNYMLYEKNFHVRRPLDFEWENKKALK